MKNKQHKYILKAFIKSRIPTAIKQNQTSLILLDSYIGGYCMQLLRGKKYIELSSNEIISSDVKREFSKLINSTFENEKEEIIIYYRLLVLVESILVQYHVDKL